MLRLIALALVACSLLPTIARAQAVPSPQRGFAFCTVTDTSHAQAKIWASPVLPVEFASDDPGGFMRGLDLAAEFLAHVGTLGGAGQKNCNVTATQGEVAALRDEQRSIWDKRMYFIKVGDWRDVTWTPKPWQPASAAANAAPATAWFLCQATQTDIPDRSDLSRTVASGVFAKPVPGANAAVAKFEQAAAYAIEFQSEVVQPHGLPVQGDCTPYDTAGEAQFAYQQMLRFSRGFNMKYREVAWIPDAPAAAMAPGAPAATTPVAAAMPGIARPAAPSAPSAPAATAAATGAELYCTAFVSRQKPALMVRAPVRRQASPVYTPASATATLSALTAAVLRAHPGDWHDLSKVVCLDNGALIAGENFCVAATYKRFGGGSQVAGMFCNASRERIDERWAEMVKADGGQAQVFPWPDAP